MDVPRSRCLLMTEAQRERSLLEFRRIFSDEEACLQHLLRAKWPDGFKCPICDHHDAWFIRTRNIFDCKKCRGKISLTSGTIFHRTRTPLLKWYRLLYHMAIEKRDVSVTEIQKKLGLEYKTAQLMFNKVKKVISVWSDGYSPFCLIEIGEGFFYRKKASRHGKEKGKMLCAVFSHNAQQRKTHFDCSIMHPLSESTGKILDDIRDTLFSYGMTSEEVGEFWEVIRKLDSNAVFDYEPFFRDLIYFGPFSRKGHQLLKQLMGGSYSDGSASIIENFLEKVYDADVSFDENEIASVMRKALRALDSVAVGGVEDLLDRLGWGVSSTEGLQLLETFHSGGWRSFNRRDKKLGLEHLRFVIRDINAVGKPLSWIQDIAYRIKANIEKLHQDAPKGQLTLQFREICYRFNRDHYERKLFDRLVKVCVSDFN